MIKKLLFVFLTAIMIFSFCSCSLFPQKTVTIEKENIATVSINRRQELLDANLEMIKAIYGECSFFTVAEFEAFATDFFSQDVIDEYFNKGVFTEKDGKIISHISTENSYDLDNIHLSLTDNNIDFKNGCQSFNVELSDGITTKIIEFTVITENDKWVLKNIYL